jgi:c-di-GMP-binding flagellar brake protein YcgR
MTQTLWRRRPQVNATGSRDKDFPGANDITAVNGETDPLKLTIGSVLQIQASVPENAPRYSVRLIGYLPAGSLVVTTPTLDGKLQIVREGQRFTARILRGQRVLAFFAKVLQVAMRPYPHLHLEYPAEFQQIVVRNASRVSADIPARLRNTQRQPDEECFQEGLIVDLSETGAKIACSEPLAEPGETLHVKFELSISGAEEEIGLLSDVKNQTKRVEPHEGGEQVAYYCGVQFRSLSRYQQILLHAWVTNQVLQDALRARQQ